MLGTSIASRRPRIRARLLAAVLALSAGAAGAQAFELEDVAKRAQELASREYEPPPPSVPGWLTELSYDQWRDVRFRPDHSLWKEDGVPFTVQFFHPGLFYDRTVAMNVVDAQGGRPIPFSPSLFDYGKTDIGSRIPQNLGFAGFRIHNPFKTRDYHDEVIVFLGASYFRAVGRNHVYGLSARGLAIDTALPSGEEFPWFREFWLLRPGARDREIVALALLDSPSVAGAYRFAIRPGDATYVDVEARLFPRRAIQKLGIAPLTSMFLRGEAGPSGFDLYQPEVHDSDGVMIATESGEWIWRPIANRTTLHVGSFAASNPRGFGLLQRDRNFDHYQDLETRPEQRPSVWVEPKGEWGPGRVELVEIPTDDDANDNVVMFWVPGTAVTPSTPLRFAYGLSWFDEAPKRPPGGYVLSTRRDRGTYEDAYRLVIDFVGGVLATLPEEEVLQGVVTVGRGEQDAAAILSQQVMRNPMTRGWRLVLQVRPPTDEPLELRAFLQRGSDALTETWSYLLVP